MDFLSDSGWHGYSRAHGIGNNNIRPCPSPLPQELCPDYWVADRTIARVKEHMKTRQDKPFFVWCSFPKPHSPYDPPMPWAAMYSPKDVPPPIGDESMIMDRSPSMQRRANPPRDGHDLPGGAPGDQGVLLRADQLPGCTDRPRDGGDEGNGRGGQHDHRLHGRPRRHDGRLRHVVQRHIPRGLRPRAVPAQGARPRKRPAAARRSWDSRIFCRRWRR